MILRTLAAVAVLSTAAPAFAQDVPAAQTAPVTPPVAAPAADPATAPAAAAPAPVSIPAPAPVVAAAPIPTGSDKVQQPEAGKGQIVFFRPSKMLGMAIGFKVRENEIELGKLNNANYFVLQVEPGKHSYVVHSEVKDTMIVEVEPGETYYVSGSISMGVVAGRPNLTPSDAKAFDSAFGRMKLSSLK